MNRLLPAMALLILFFSCSEKGPVSKIPEDASLVVFVDFKRLALQAFDLNSFFEDEKRKPTNRQTDWENTGLDILSKAVLFSHPNEKGDLQLFLMLPLKDQEVFRKFCKEKLQFQADARLGEGWLKKDNWIVSISEELAIFIKAELLQGPEELQKEVKRISSLEPEQNLDKKSTEFSELLGEGRSIGIWANLESLYESDKFLIPSGLLQGILCGSADFKTGELVLNARIQQKDTSQSEQIFSSPLDKGFLEACSFSGNQLGMLALNVSMSGIWALSESTPYGTTPDLILSSYGLSLKDLSENLSGAFAISAFEPNHNPDAVFPDFRFLAGTKNPSGILIQKMSDAGVLQNEGLGTFTLSGMPDIRLMQHKNHIEISSMPSNTSYGTEEEKLRNFATSEPAHFIASLNLEKLGKNPASVGNIAAAAAITSNWKRLNIRMFKSNPELSQYQLSLSCMNENQNSFQALMKSLSEVQETTESKPAL